MVLHLFGRPVRHYLVEVETDLPGVAVYELEADEDDLAAAIDHVRRLSLRGSVRPRRRRDPHSRP